MGDLQMKYLNAQDHTHAELHIMFCRAKLDELFSKRQEYHKGITSSMPSGTMGQEFAVQYLRVRLHVY